MASGGNCSRPSIVRFPLRWLRGELVEGIDERVQKIAPVSAKTAYRTSPLPMWTTAACSSVTQTSVIIAAGSSVQR